MTRDFYTPFPYDLPSLPAVRRLGRSQWGARARLAYYDLRVYAGLSYQYGGTLRLEDALSYAPEWDMTEDEAAGAIRMMAELRLIDPEMLGDGLIGVPDVAERAQYLMRKAEAGRLGNEKRWGKKKSECACESQAESQAESQD